MVEPEAQHKQQQQQQQKQQQQQQHRQCRRIFHRYFLQRLGLVPDEVDWPPPNKDIDGGDSDYGCGGAPPPSPPSFWRARDALTSLLGRECSSIMSDSGLTATEMSLLAVADTSEAGGGSSADAPAAVPSSSWTVPVASIVPPFPWNSEEDWGADDSGRVDVVRRAFDAAAFAVVRGHQQRAVLATAASSPSTGSGAHFDANSKKNGDHYEPPLLLAMEAIRTSRILALDEASASDSVPPFLKKNNTIGWFHAPAEKYARAGNERGVVAGGGGGATASSRVAGATISAVATSSAISVNIGTDSGGGAVSMGTAGTEILGLGGDGQRNSSIIIVDNAKVVRTETGARKRSHQEVSSSATNDNALKKKKRRALEKIDTLKDDDDSTKTAHHGGGTKEKKHIFTNKGDTTQSSTPQKSFAANQGETALCSPLKQFSSLTSSSFSNQTRHKKNSRVPSSAASITVEDITGLGGGASAPVTRAVISAAAAAVFQEFHPKYDDDAHSIVTNDSHDAAAIVRNVDGGPLPGKGLNKLTSQYKAKEEGGDAEVPTADRVIAQATRLGDRVLDHTKGAARRGDQRREFRQDAALSRLGNGTAAVGSVALPSQDGKRQAVLAGRSPFVMGPAHALPLVVPNPFLSAVAHGVDENAKEYLDSGGRRDGTSLLVRGPSTAPWKRNAGKSDAAWTESCLPRLLSVLRKGAGHAVLHDMQWDERSFRVADLLRHMALSPRRKHLRDSQENGAGGHNYGPHLIVTSGGEDFDKFACVFAQLGHGLMPHSDLGIGGEGCNTDVDPSVADDILLRVLPYHGPRSYRTRLRRHFGSLIRPSPDSHFAFLAGLRNAPFHVILTTYAVLIEDYAHFCQIPFQTVVLDDGMGWLGCAEADPHGKIGKVWNTGLWSSFDHGAGGAGVVGVEEEGGGGKISTWDFSRDVAGADTDGKSASSNSSGVSTAAAIATTGGRHRLGLTARHRILLASNMHAVYRGRIHTAPLLELLSFLAPSFADAIRDGWERSKVSACKKSMAYIRTMVARLVVVYSRGNPIVCVGRLSADDLITLSLKSLDGELPLRTLNYRIGQEDEGIDKLINSQKIIQSRKHSAAWFQPSSPIRKEFGKIPSFDFILAAVKKVHAMGFVCEEVVTASSLTTSGSGGCAVGPSAYRAAVRCGRCFSSEQGLKLHIASCHSGAGTWLCRNCGEDCGTSQARIHHERTCGKPIKGSTQAPAVGEGTKATRGRKKKVVKNPVAPKEDVDGTLFSEHNTFAKGDGKPQGPNGSEKETPCSGISGTNPDLSVIDIKDLPPYVKPLLRDPNQTSRTGGNSKRYVYAYRGVCRQQRKGHDRWQSQISFNGTNHYLGTFDSEWDAAAVYAWAHLILYGEEATKEAQREGEEAAAAFAQHEQDIAEGKIPPPSSSKPPAKKKKRGAPKKNTHKADKGGKSLLNKPQEDSRADMVCEANGSDVSVAETSASAQSKKKKPMSLREWRKLKTECAMMLSSGTKGTSKATILATRKDVAQMSERLLLQNISDYISGHLSSVSKSFLQSRQTISVSFQQLPPPDVSSTQFVPPMLVGLRASDVAWEIETFIETCQDASVAQDAVASYSKLFNEFGASGVNHSFHTFLLLPSCTFGRASKGSQNKLLSSCHVNDMLGIPAGSVDCNIGGPEYSCSEMAAEIQFLPSKYSNFQFMACNDDDIVTLNGQQMSASMGSFPLRDMDICSVGARVFCFIEDINF